VRTVDPASRTTLHPAPQLPSDRCLVIMNIDHDLAGLARQLATECGYDGDDLSFPIVAQFYKSLCGSELISRLMDWTEERSGSLAHELEQVAKLPISKFVSLSFCSHLEEALRLAGRRVHSVVKGSDIPYGQDAQVLVVKPLGTLDQQDSLVITENDYADFFEHKKNLIRHLKQLIASHNLVVIGCDPTDEYSQLVLGGLLDGADSTDRRCFAVVDPAHPPKTVEAWTTLGVCPLVLPITSLANLFVVTVPESELTVQSPVIGRRPYKFLAYYDERDADLFCGRLADIDRLLNLLRTGPLTVLCGRSGVGKTSLLRAGVIPWLRERNDVPLYVRVGDDPIQAIQVAAWLTLTQDQRKKVDQSLPLLSFLSQIVQMQGRHVTVLVDQFEECFTGLNEFTRLKFAKELQTCLRHERNDLRFVLSLREDFMADLDTLSSHVPTILQDEHIYRLEALNRDQALSAIRDPASRCRLEVEDQLANALVTDLNTPDGIQPAQLSIVCDRLYESLRRGEDKITLKHYENLGKASRILADYVDHVLEAFVPSDRGQAVAILKNMVTCQQTKAVLSKSQVLAGIGVKGDAILERLVKDNRLVRSFEEQKEGRYELAHECLVDKLQSWTNAEEARTRAVVELVRRELRAWYSMGHLVETKRLDVAFAERENPGLLLSGEELALLSLSATYHKIEADPWVAKLKVTEDQLNNGMTLLVAALQAKDESVQRAALEAIAQLLNMPAIRDLGRLNVDTRLRAVETLGQRGNARAVEPLITRLDDTDGRVRQAAAEALRQLGDAKAVEPLITRLGDEDERVRQAAAEALGQLGDDRAIDPLVERFDDSNEQVRCATAEALRWIGGARGVELLVQHLDDPYPWIRQVAAKALGQLRDARAVEPLVKQLNDWYPWVRQAVAEALGQLGDVRAVQPLLGRLDDTDEHVRRAAAAALGQLGDVRAVQPLLSRLGDPDERFRRAAVEGIRRCGNTRAIELLAQQLDDPYPWVRQAVVKALGQIEDTRVIEPLVEQLGSQDQLVRWAAVEALGGIGDARAMKPLVERLSDRDQLVARAAAKALGQLRDIRAVQPLTESMRDPRALVRRAAVESLGQLGDDCAIGLLIEQLNDSSKQVRWTAATALGRIGDTRAVEPLVKCLRDREHSVRQASIMALRQIGDVRAVEMLVKRLRNRDMRWVAVNALGEIGDVRATVPLAERLSDNNVDMQWAAARALKQIGDPRAIETLVKRSGYRDERVRRATADTLRRIGDAWAIGPLVELLLDEDNQVRQAATDALTQIADTEAVESLMNWIVETDKRVWQAAEDALKQLGDARAVEPLVKRLNDPVSAVRRAAANILTWLQWSPQTDAIGAAYWFEFEIEDKCIEIGSAAVEPLLKRLEDSDREVRERAAKYLGQIADVQAVEPLVKRLSDDNESVRWAVVEALGRIGDVRAIEPLVERLNDPVSAVRRAAADVLTWWSWSPQADAAGAAYWFELEDDQKCTEIGSPAVEPLVGQLEDDDPEVRRRAARCLGQIGESRATGALVKHLSDSNRQARQEAMAALGLVGDGRAVEPLVMFLHDTDEQVRQVAAKALGQIRDPRAVGPLIERLSDRKGLEKVLNWVLYRDPRDKRVPLFLQEPYEHVRRAAAEALGQIGDPQAVKQLAKQLRHRQAQVRRTTVQALGWIGDAQAIEPLLGRLRDPEGVVRREAADTLGRLGWYPQADADAAAYWFELENKDECVRVGKAAIEPLGERLKDRDPEVRARAAKYLGHIVDARVVELLVKRLSDQDEGVRWAAGQALELLGAPAVEPLLKRLGDRNKDVRLAAAETLGQIGDVRAVEPLVERLSDRNDDVRWEVMDALVWIGAPVVVSLMERLSDQNTAVRLAAVRALGRIGDAQAIEPLLERLHDPEGVVRRAAADTLGRLGWHPQADAKAAAYWFELGDKYECIGVGKAAIEPLSERLKDRDPVMRARAAEYLGHIVDARVVELLVKGLSDRDDGVRRAAGQALELIGAPAVEPLLKRLSDRNKDVRLAAAETLGQIGDVRAVEPLVERLSDRDTDVRWAAVDALGWIGAPAVVPLVEQCNDRDDEFRQAVVEALTQIGAPAVALLVEQMGDRDTDVRWAAVNALGHIGDAQAVEPLVERLSDRDTDVRWAAVEALGQIGDPRAVEPLVERLSDRDTDVRWAAAEALGQTGDPRAVGPLVERLNDPFDDFGWAAVEALGQIQDSQAAETLFGPSEVIPLLERIQALRKGIPQTALELLQTAQGAPIHRFFTTYELGEDTYDESFSIETTLGEFLGECGVGISETIGQGSPDKVTALEVWLFDKSDIRTITTVLLSAHAYSNDQLRARLAPKGELVLAKTGEIFSLRTSSLGVFGVVQEMEYGTAEEPPPISFFTRISVSLIAFPVYTQNGASITF